MQAARHTPVGQSFGQKKRGAKGSWKATNVPWFLRTELGRGKERSLKNQIRHEPSNEQVGWQRQNRPCIRHTRNERLPQTKGGIITFVLTLLPFINDYTTRSWKSFSVNSNYSTSIFICQKCYLHWNIALSWNLVKNQPNMILYPYLADSSYR